MLGDRFLLQYCVESKRIGPLPAALVWHTQGKRGKRLDCSQVSLDEEGGGDLCYVRSSRDLHSKTVLLTWKPAGDMSVRGYGQIEYESFGFPPHWARRRNDHLPNSFMNVWCR